MIAARLAIVREVREISMRDAMHDALLGPIVALIAWSLVMWVWLYATRLPAMVRLRMPASAGRYARAMNERMPDHARQAADNYNHLMEQPTLFYAVGFALVLLGRGDDSTCVALAWGYVALRVVHSLVQATVNHVPTRFAVFTLSTLLLMGLTASAVSALA
jgi:hypothetical protein